MNMKFLKYSLLALCCAPVFGTDSFYYHKDDCGKNCSIVCEHIQKYKEKQDAQCENILKILKNFTNMETEKRIQQPENEMLKQQISMFPIVESIMHAEFHNASTEEERYFLKRVQALMLEISSEVKAKKQEKVQKKQKKFKIKTRKTRKNS